MVAACNKESQYQFEYLLEVDSRYNHPSSRFYAKIWAINYYIDIDQVSVNLGPWVPDRINKTINATTHFIRTPYFPVKKNLYINGHGLFKRTDQISNTNNLCKGEMVRELHRSCPRKELHTASSCLRG